MSSTKKLQKAAQKFRRENPQLYAALAMRCHLLAETIKRYGTDNQG